MATGTSELLATIDAVVGASDNLAMQIAFDGLDCAMSEGADPSAVGKSWVNATHIHWERGIKGGVHGGVAEPVFYGLGGGDLQCECEYCLDTIPHRDPFLPRHGSVV